jgi:hypothetical protein
MRPFFGWRPVLHLTLLALTAPWQQSDNAAHILTPVPGEALQGLVAVEGDAYGPDFSGYTLTFASADDPTGTRFVIQSGSRPVEKGLLGEWDTGHLSDGEYILFLTVELTDGGQLESRVDDLRVRNYSPIETNTPSPSETPAPGLAPSLTPTLPSPLPTPFPPNPAELPEWAVQRSIIIGLVAGPVLLAGLAWYSRRTRK